jgi:diketogulonate reductase-like aldo/keto reductase
MKESGLCRQACLWALEAGYRHIDTAKVYENEVEVGEALAECGIERSEVFVTTKLRSLDATSHDAVLEHCQASLERLGLEQVDLYLVHAPPPDIDCRAEVWRGMETCLENGWTRAIGVSNYGRHHLDALMEAARYGPSVNQVEIHPWLQRPDLIAATLEVGAVPMAYSPLARGHKVEDPQLAKIADAIGCTPAQAALKWCMDQGYITIPKSSNEQRIAENLAALDVDVAEQSDALDALEENYISGWDPTTEP